MKENNNFNYQNYKYYKTLPRSNFELWLDVHNHKLELLRTLSSLLGVILQVFVLLKIFGKI